MTRIRGFPITHIIGVWRLIVLASRASRVSHCAMKGRGRPARPPQGLLVSRPQGAAGFRWVCSQARSGSCPASYGTWRRRPSEARTRAAGDQVPFDVGGPHPLGHVLHLGGDLLDHLPARKVPVPVAGRVSGRGGRPADSDRLPLGSVWPVSQSMVTLEVSARPSGRPNSVCSTSSTARTMKLTTGSAYTRPRRLAHWRGYRRRERFHKSAGRDPADRSLPKACISFLTSWPGRMRARSSITQAIRSSSAHRR